MEFKYIQLDKNISIVKIKSDIFIHIRKHADKISVTSNIELDDHTVCYDKYINMFDDRKNNILINKDFNYKKVEIRGINVIMFNLAETSLYSVCLDEYYNLWLYNRTQQTWSRLYGFDSYGKYKKVISKRNTSKDDFIINTFGVKAYPVNNKLRFVLQCAKDNEFYFRLLTNAGQEQHLVIANDNKIYLNKKNKYMNDFTWVEYEPKHLEDYSQ